MRCASACLGVRRHLLRQPVPQRLLDRAIIIAVVILEEGKAGAAVAVAEIPMTGRVIIHLLPRPGQGSSTALTRLPRGRRHIYKVQIGITMETSSKSHDSLCGTLDHLMVDLALAEQEQVTKTTATEEKGRRKGEQERGKKKATLHISVQFHIRHLIIPFEMKT